VKKYLAVVERCDGGFRGYLPRLPGCEVRAATAEEAGAKIIDAGRARLATENGAKPDEVEIVVAVEAPPPPRPRPDGLDDLYDQLHREFDPLDLEFFLNLDEQQGCSFEELMAELGLDPEGPTLDEAAE
jgi:predicted RNase H-like HicB family nuclease